MQKYSYLELTDRPVASIVTGVDHDVERGEIF